MRCTISLLASALAGALSAQDLGNLCLPQSSGRFWSVADGLVQEWTVSGGVISGGATVLQGPSDMNSLAFCSASGPTTFYGDAPGSGLQYFNDGAWQQVPFAAAVYNHGGSGEHLYFVDTSNDLYYFTGSTATLIATPDPGAFRCDIVVDPDGNAIVPYGPSGLGTWATGFRKYAPDGTLLNTYALSFDGYLGYGAFLLGNVMYIGFGATNVTYTNKVVPFTLSGTTATAGTPIPFIPGDILDFASCTESPVGIQETGASRTEILVRYAQDGEQIFIDLPAGAVHDLSPVRLVAASGSVVPVEHMTSAGRTVVIPTSGLPNGIYALAIRCTDGTERVARLAIGHGSL